MVVVIVLKLPDRVVVVIVVKLPDRASVVIVVKLPDRQGLGHNGEITRWSVCGYRSEIA